MSQATFEESHKIIDETRSSTVEALLAFGNIKGDKSYNEFAKEVAKRIM